MSDELDVWIEGRLAGSLERDARHGLTFTYEEAYRTARGSTPLSRSMPKHIAEHGDAVAGPWFDNLLPDNEEVRRRWAAGLGAPSSSVFNLLEGMGIDCAGAVQVVPSGVIPDQTGGYEAIAEADIEEHLRVLRADEGAWNLGDHGGRWSLGGAQGKFALAQGVDGGWTVPSGRSPSTHIVKVGVVRFAYADIAEFVSMRAAFHLGLPVASVEMARFGNQTALVVGRYDRVAVDGGIRRFHQEDLCQALAVNRASKYEGDHGPGLRQVNELLTGLDVRDQPASRELFVRAQVYNWLAGGVDAHAKNYSLLLTGDRARLAPLYDLTAGVLLLDPERLYYKGKLAMKLGGEYRLRNIDERNLQRAAIELAVSEEWLTHVVQDYRERLPDAFSDAANEAIAGGGDGVDPVIKGRYIDGLARYLNLVARPAGR